MPGIFKSFRSTVNPWFPETWRSTLRLLVDGKTGAPIGIESPNANGPDGIWTPIDLTAAQIAAPTAAMLADLNATYRLNVAPYTRYHSTGAKIVPAGDSDEVVIERGFNTVFYSPLVVQDTEVLVVEGEIRVIDYPA